LDNHNKEIMPRLYKIVWGFIFICFLHISFLFAGEVYHWMDEKGTIHFTDDPSKIPQSYIDQVEKKKTVEESLKIEKRIAKPDQEESPNRVKKYLDNIEEKIGRKKNLEKRIDELEEELRLSEGRLKKIEENEKERPQPFYSYFDKRTKKWIVTSSYYEEKISLNERIKLLREELISVKEKLSQITQGL
jgi:hypothetical protein